MRHVLTIVAVVLVAALCAALVAPLFIDWTAFREQIDARLGSAIGARVHTTGPIGLRLLPTPTLTLGATTLESGDPADPSLQFASAHFELALVKLAGGAFRFTQATLERPVLTLTQSADGALRLPPLPTASQADRIGFDRLRVEDGTLRLVREGRIVREIAGVALEASAASLNGPVRATIDLADPFGAPVAIEALTGPRRDGDVPIKASAVWKDSALSLEFDGALAGETSAAAPGAAILKFNGQTTLSGQASAGEGDAPLPWRVAGFAAIDPAGLAMEAAEVEVGSGERAFKASGPVRLAFAAPLALRAELTARQLNVDALLRQKDEASIAPNRAFAALAAAVQPLGPSKDWPIKADISFAAPSGALGGQAVADFSLEARAEPGAALRTRFEVALPGRGRIKGDGEWDYSLAPGFNGRLDASLDDISAFSVWASAQAPELAARLTALNESFPYRAASASGDVAASSVGFSARDLKLTLDRSSLRGALAFTGAVGSDRGRLYMDLRADSLDVDSLPNLTSSASLLGDLDLSLALEAGSLRVARVGESEIESGSLALKLTKAGSEFSLDRLSIAGLGGADVEAKGASNASGAWASGKVSARDLKDFAFLVSRVAPGDISRALVERAEALSPISLSVQARGVPDAAGGLAFSAFKAEGTAGRTTLALGLDRARVGDGRVASLTLDSPDASALLRQLGLRGAANASASVHIAGNARGRWESGFDGDAAIAIAGSDLSWRGKLVPSARGSDDAALYGSTNLKSANLAPLLAVLGMAQPGGPAIGPAEISSDVTLRGDRWTFSRLAGAIAGAKLNGKLSYRPAPPAAAAPPVDIEIDLAREAAGETSRGTQSPEIEGELAVDRFALGALLSTQLGAAQPTKAGHMWSDEKFAEPTLNLPSAEIDLRAGAADLTDSIQARGFASKLRLGRGRIELDAMTMALAGGSVGGRFELRRSGALATITGALSANGLALDRPGLGGRFGAELDFASTGPSAIAIAEGLAGRGQLQVAGAAIPHLDADALDRVVANAQNPDATLDETNLAYRLSNELDRAALAIPDGFYPMSLSAGVGKIGPIARARGATQLSASLDLRSLTLETQVAQTGVDNLKFWSGPPPSATITMRSALEKPAREVDVGALAAGLSAQAIARESDRIAALDADIRERAYFNRRAKAEKYMDFEAGELAAFERDAPRRRSLAERAHAETEAIKAAAPPPAPPPSQIEAPPTPTEPTPGATPVPGAGAAVAPDTTGSVSENLPSTPSSFTPPAGPAPQPPARPKNAPIIQPAPGALY